MEATEIEEILRSATPWHYRCVFFGLHKRADYLLPESPHRPIARHTVCLRCGLLLEIEIFQRSQSARNSPKHQQGRAA